MTVHLIWSLFILISILKNHYVTGQIVKYDASSTLMSRISNLLDTQYQYDVTLFVGHGEDIKTFKVHKLIMSISSPVFADILRESSSKTVHLSNMSPRIFEIILNYIYKDLVEVEQLRDTWELWIAASNYGLTPLVQATEPIIDKHASYLLNIIEFTYLPEEVVAEILQRPMLNAPEVRIFEGLKYWAEESLVRDNMTALPDNLQNKVTSLLPMIDLESMSPLELTDVVVPSGLVPTTQMNALLVKLVKKVMPDAETGHSPSRIQRREVTCRRQNDVEDVSYLIESAPTDHYLKFNTNCSSPCYLAAVQVTSYFVKEDGQSVSVNALLEISDHDGSKLYWDARILSEPYEFRLYNPLLLRDGETYRVHLWTGDFKAGNEVEGHIIPFGLQFCSNCQSEMWCGKVMVQMLPDPKSEFTSATSGLVSSLKFYV